MATAAVRDSTFFRSLELFKIGLSDGEKNYFELTTLEEIHEVIDRIQDEQASKRTMQNMARIQGFLEGMEQYGHVIEVFLNVSVFVAFIWVRCDIIFCDYGSCQVIAHNFNCRDPLNFCCR